jgi:16S rRNA pseudouridine516 synthase
VQTAEPIAEQAVRQFAQGLYLHAEKERLQPAELQILDSCAARVIISEGRYHQVKRMFGALGNAVVKLHRERIGAIVLDAGLAPGQYRPLTAAEVAGAQ